MAGRKRTKPATKGIPPMAGRGGQLKKGRKNFAAAKRVKESAELYAQGLTQQQIAEQKGESQSTVSRDLRAAYEEMRQATIGSMVAWQRTWRDKSLAMVETELEKLEREEAELWKAWERSKLDKKWERQRTWPEGTEVTAHTEGQAGDPRLMTLILQCHEKRVALHRFADEVIGILGPDRTLPEWLPEGGSTFEAAVRIYVPDNGRTVGNAGKR